MPGIFKGPPPLPNSARPGVAPLPPVNAVTNSPAMSFFNCTPLSPKLVFIFSAAAIICYIIYFLAFIAGNKVIVISLVLIWFGLLITAVYSAAYCSTASGTAYQQKSAPPLLAKLSGFCSSRYSIATGYFVQSGVYLFALKTCCAPGAIWLTRRLAWQQHVVIVSIAILPIPFLATLIGAANTALWSIWLYKQANATAELVGAPSSRKETLPWLNHFFGRKWRLVVDALVGTSVQLSQNASQPQYGFSPYSSSPGNSSPLRRNRDLFILWWNRLEHIPVRDV